jgi:hypothetical protein
MSTPLGTVEVTPDTAMNYSYSYSDRRRVLTEIRVLASLPDGLQAPEATKFVFAFETVTNTSDMPLELGWPGFILQDNRGRVYGAESYPVQSDAQRYFGRKGEEWTLGPGVTEDAVFVWLVSADAAGFVLVPR